VKAGIEACLCCSLNEEQTKSSLCTQHGIDPAVTSYVWNLLQEKNPTFFRMYEIKMKLIEQITVYHSLMKSYSQYKINKATLSVEDNKENTSTNNNTTSTSTNSKAYEAVIDAGINELSSAQLERGKPKAKGKGIASPSTPSMPQSTGNPFQRQSSIEVRPWLANTERQTQVQMRSNPFQIEQQKEHEERRKEREKEKEKEKDKDKEKGGEGREKKKDPRKKEGEKKGAEVVHLEEELKRNQAAKTTNSRGGNGNYGADFVRLFP